MIIFSWKILLKISSAMLNYFVEMNFGLTKILTAFEKQIVKFIV